MDRLIAAHLCLKGLIEIRQSSSYIESMLYKLDPLIFHNAECRQFGVTNINLNKG